MYHITTEDLRCMSNCEGLILQGCGGNLQEWVDGINDDLTQNGILLNQSRLETVFVFEHKGSTNLLFLFGNTPMDIGKLAIWRLQTYAQFGGTWLSDYVPNQLGGFRMVKMRDKPDFMLCDAL